MHLLGCPVHIIITWSAHAHKLLLTSQGRIQDLKKGGAKCMGVKRP